MGLMMQQLWLVLNMMQSGMQMYAMATLPEA